MRSRGRNRRRRHRRRRRSSDPPGACGGHGGAPRRALGAREHLPGARAGAQAVRPGRDGAGDAGRERLRAGLGGGDRSPSEPVPRRRGATAFALLPGRRPVRLRRLRQQPGRRRALAPHQGAHAPDRKPAGAGGTFRIRIRDGRLHLTPRITAAQKREALAHPLEFSSAGWMVAVAFPGHAWQRVPCNEWC